MSAYHDPIHLLALHRQLLAGDRVASEEVASLLLDPLTQEVSSQFPHMDREFIWDGVVDAILDYCARPHQFDENRGVPLDRFLHLASWRNVENVRRKEKRRRAREEKVGQDPTEIAVALDSSVGNIVQKEETAKHYQQQEKLMSALSDPKDQQILALRLQGERRTGAFAQVLDITHLPIKMQRQQVKRTKDRIDKTLRRHTRDEK